jgi:hypothetical protein
MYWYIDTYKKQVWSCHCHCLATSLKSNCTALYCWTTPITFCFVLFENQNSTVLLDRSSMESMPAGHSCRSWMWHVTSSIYMYIPLHCNSSLTSPSPCPILSQASYIQPLHSLTKAWLGDRTWAKQMSHQEHLSAFYKRAYNTLPLKKHYAKTDQIVEISIHINKIEI